MGWGAEDLIINLTFLAKHKYFEAFILFMILISSLTLVSIVYPWGQSEGRVGRAVGREGRGWGVGC